MWKYVVKRILQLIPIILLVSFLVFWLMSLTGDPVRNLLGDQATQEQIEAKRAELGLDKPLVVRYGIYMFDLVRGDMGEALDGKSVSEQFGQRFPYTMLLCGTSILLTVIISVPAGIFAATHKDSLLDTGISVFALAGISVPVFWIGMLLILLFGVKLGWLPTSGIQQGLAKSLILPTVCSSVQCLAAMERMTRASMLDNLNSDYLRTARAKGVKEKTVVWKHALGNALIPIITSIGGQISLLIGGAVSLETVFSWPGIGSYVVAAVRSGDYNVVTGSVIVLTVVVSLVTVAVDIAYAFVDPRIKAKYTGK